jgi:hypothetical protein
LRLDLLLHIGDGNGGSMAAAVNFSEFTEAAAVDVPEFSGNTFASIFGKHVVVVVAI